MSFPAPEDNRTLVDALLAEQQRLTAVERFSQAHERGDFSEREKHYRRLLPASAPKPGQQYAFEVDLDKCSGCKACVTACHSLNGLDDNETWRSVGQLFSDDWRAPRQQTVTTACHHCVEPGCLEGCPVLAYDKDPLTGIVRHLDDQCIGCQYCVMKCPYEVPQYSARRGIVRKCDMCASRLAVGEAPACAQACPNEAIRITLVDTDVLKASFRASPAAANPFLPASPAPALTVPTTQFKSSQPLPSTLLAANHAEIKTEPAHLPLVIMLVFSQLSVGSACAAIAHPAAGKLAVISAVTGQLAILVASLHLGKPLKAWRAFLGWRQSWFSREVIVFSAFLGFALPAAAANWIPVLLPHQGKLLAAAALTGLAGMFCSAMIYADTGREFWRRSQCLGKFFGTTWLLGSLVLLVVTGQPGGWLVGLIFTAAVFKLAVEQRIARELPEGDALTLTSLNKSALLLKGPLGLAARGRIAAGMLGGIALPGLCLVLPHFKALAVAALTLAVLGELLERYLFFTAVAPVKMPGGFSA
ncbi:MAG: DmsC/YnfH family molybdoenzyme membrane anchor subunit [Verrucomicrobiota bacterium]